MLVTFFALSTGVALVTPRRLWEKLFIITSAIPIALATNVVRITATGLLYQGVGGEAAHAFFHDVAGWLMMPFALGLLWLELKALDRLLLEPAPRRRAMVGAALPRAAAPGRTEKPRHWTDWPSKRAALRPTGESGA
jgi:exosortase/archaeosortase family protein